MKLYLTLLTVVIVMTAGLLFAGVGSASTTPPRATYHYVEIPAPAGRMARQRVLDSAGKQGYRLAAIDGSNFILVRPR